MRSGDARLIRMASKSDVSWLFSWRLGLMDLLDQKKLRTSKRELRNHLRPDRRGRRGLGFFRRRRLLEDRFRLRAHQLDVQTQRLKLADEHVKRLRQPRLERRVALD